MEHIKCIVLTCDTELRHPEEVKHNQICMACRKRLTGGAFAISQCWNCGRLIGIFKKPKWLSKVVGTTKPLILMAKGCRVCCYGTTDLESSWKTIKGNGEKSENYVVGKDGLEALRPRVAITVENFEKDKV